MIVNVWLALRDDAQAALHEALTTEDYSGPVPARVVRLFKKMADRAEVQRLFKTRTPVSRTWTLWSVYFDEPASVLQKVQEELDNLVATYPSRVSIIGAWHIDGRQVGTQYDDDGNLVGTPTYSIPGFLSDFMPDDIDENGNPVPNPTVRDVNLILGQKPRNFS